MLLYGIFYLICVPKFSKVGLSILSVGLGSLLSSRPQFLVNLKSAPGQYKTIDTNVFLSLHLRRTRQVITRHYFIWQNITRYNHISTQPPNDTTIYRHFHIRAKIHNFDQKQHFVIWTNHQKPKKIFFHTNIKNISA